MVLLSFQSDDSITRNKASDNKPLDKAIQTVAEKRGSMTWAARLKRVFNIDMNSCCACGGAVKVVACIDDPVVITLSGLGYDYAARLTGLTAQPPGWLLAGKFTELMSNKNIKLAVLMQPAEPQPKSRCVIC